MGALCPQFPVTVTVPWGQVTRTFEFQLVNSLWAWFLYESRTGLQVGDTAGSARNTRTLLWALLQTEHPDLTEEAVGSLPHAVMAELMRMAALALTTAAPDDASLSLKAESVRKSTDWYRLWATARFDLGLSDAEFWALHPLQFHHLCLRLDARIDREFYGHCITAAMIRNCNIDPEKTEPIAPMALMPTASGEKARAQLAAPAAPQSVSLVEKVRQMKAALGAL